jgi:hypothetical protein
MRGFLIRVAKTVVPAAALAAGGGYLFAQMAGQYVATPRDDGEALRATLASRLPFTMAAWCGGMVLVFELFRSLWGQKPKPVESPRGVDAEQLLQQLLEQADAAEQARQAATKPPITLISEDTPPPLAEPLPLPEIHFPTESAGS